MEQAVRRAPADKAPGDDNIPNGILHIVLPIILPILTKLFNACMTLGYNPTHFRHSVTVTLRKPGRKSYRLPNSYRPVALLNTIGKALEAVIAGRISYAAEQHGLFPKTHLGGRKGISVDHAIQLIIEKVRRAWGAGFRVVSFLLKDVTGAYNYANHTRMLHNLRMLGLGQLVPWIQSFLSNRTTRIRMPETTTGVIPTPTGIPQGSPLSPILYLLYNQELIRLLTRRTRSIDDLRMGRPHCPSTAFGWVDDVAVTVEGRTKQETIQKLQDLHETADDWAKRHASIFAPDKYKLIHFINPNAPSDPWDAEEPILTLSGVEIKPSQAAKYLGVWFDPGLTFSEHRRQAMASAEACIEALKGIAGSTWGTSLEGMIKVYNALVIPKMLFGAAAWYNQHNRDLGPGINASIVNSFTAIQKRAAILISGAFRKTAAEALNMELHLLPIRQLLDKQVQETAVRLMTGPTVGQPKLDRTLEETKLGGKTPMELHAQKGCLKLNAGEYWERRMAFITAPWEQPPIVHIEEKEQVIDRNKVIEEQHKSRGGSLLIYMDGSTYRGHIRAAAVAGDKYRHLYMGL